LTASASAEMSSSTARTLSWQNGFIHSGGPLALTKLPYGKQRSYSQSFRLTSQTVACELQLSYPDALPISWVQARCVRFLKSHFYLSTLRETLYDERRRALLVSAQQGLGLELF